MTPHYVFFPHLCHLVFFLPDALLQPSHFVTSPLDLDDFFFPVLREDFPRFLETLVRQLAEGDIGACCQCGAPATGFLWGGDFLYGGGRVRCAGCGLCLGCGRSIWDLLLGRKFVVGSLMEVEEVCLSLGRLGRWSWLRSEWGGGWRVLSWRVHLM